jgi:hypothetical protein
MRRRSSFLTALFVCALAAGHAAAQEQDHSHHHAHAEKLGTVTFETSCAPAVKAPFARAVALLHSFWYDEAEKAFGEVAKADPSCAMAHWGVAMSVYHPIWAPPTPAELERGQEAVAKAKATAASTARERDYIAAIETFFRDADTVDHRTRAVAYEKAMEGVFARHPDDREAAIFYALALLGTAPPGDKTYANQKKAGAILNRVLPAQPDHPGVAHYLITASTTRSSPTWRCRPRAATRRSPSPRRTRCTCRRTSSCASACGTTRSAPTWSRRRPRAPTSKSPCPGATRSTSCTPWTTWPTRTCSRAGTPRPARW